jgi:hypothetical protein
MPSDLLLDDHMCKILSNDILSSMPRSSKGCFLSVFQMTSLRFVFFNLSLLYGLVYMISA